MEKFQSRFKNDVYSDSKNDNQIWCVFFFLLTWYLCAAISNTDFGQVLELSNRDIHSHWLHIQFWTHENVRSTSYYVHSHLPPHTHTHTSVISEANNIIETRSAFNLFRVQAIESLMCWNGLASGRIGTFYTDSGKVKCHSIGIIWNQNCIHTGSCRHGVKYHYSRM